jgi:16S rRNA (guanine966-N2)-methyltransferase
MRVVAGSAKGVRLAPVPAGVRPVSDMAREGLFSSIGPDVAGARVLDLYAGTGAMAVEALSRGAGRAVLVERNRTAQRTIHENVRRVGAEDRSTVVGSDVGTFLGRDHRDAFDLVLMDPPYEAPVEEIESVLRRLRDGWLAPPPWTVALTRPRRGPEPVVPEDWAAAKRLSYGDTIVLVYRASHASSPSS